MNCYLCGHPILEGQKSQVHAKVEGFMTDLLSHMNPADHLPTLMPDGNAELIRLRADPAFVKAQAQFDIDQDARIEERERAAKMVEEAGTLADRGMMVDHIWVSNLADQIRSGE